MDHSSQEIQKLEISAECRWFMQGSLPGHVNQWFLKSSPFSDQLNTEVRTDRYLKFPNSFTTGVKIREGKLEVKPLVEYLEIDWPEHVAGNVQTWEKWSYDDQEPCIANIPGRDTHEWIQVEKSRILRFLNEEMIEKSPTHQLDAGCEIELSSIEIRNKLYWSFAIEAFGKHAEVKKILQHAIWLWEEHYNLSEVVQTTEENSFAYPALLSSF